MAGIGGKRGRDGVFQFSHELTFSGDANDRNWVKIGR